ncbi:MAG: hypothetical protein EOL88_00570 [Bacteroidia bacterium]|nr:hypothetical protein [Bacteroidia bacterium]
MARQNTSNKEEKKETKKLVLIEFVKPHTPYIKGEVAGFNKSLAEKFIKKGFAKEYKKSK